MMGKKMKGAALALVLVGAGVALTGCVSDADTVSHNLSQDAERFQIQRRIVFYNGFTDTIMYQIEGRCSVETADSALAGALEVTCKTGPDAYHKDFLYLSDNVTPVIQQIEDTDVSEYHYSFIFKPEGALPNIDIDTKAEDGPGH